MTLILCILLFIPKNYQHNPNDTPLAEQRSKKKRPANKVEKKETLKELPFLNDSIHPFISEIVAFTDEKEAFQRNKKIYLLKEVKLNEPSRQALYSFLKQPPANAGPNISLHSLKNDILNYFIHHLRPDISIGLIITEIMNDTNQHQIMREYAAQFTLNYFERAWPEGDDYEFTSQEAILKKEIEMALWNMTELKLGSMSGTAITKLHELSERHSDISKEQIAATAFKISTDPSVETASRMGALDILAKYPNEEGQNYMKEIALDNSQPITLRMVAIASYSSSSSEDLEFNEFLERSLANKETDKRIKWAAKAALK